MYYVYILKLCNKTYYVGYTNDLKRRIGEHKRKEVVTTSKAKSIVLECYFAFRSKQKALDFERYLKTGSGIAFRKKRFLGG